MKNYLPVLIFSLVVLPAIADAQVADTNARARDSALVARMREAEETYRRLLLEVQARGLHERLNERGSAAAELYRLRQASQDARTVELYANRQITRRELDSQLGALRADSAIRALQTRDEQRRTTEELVRAATRLQTQASTYQAELEARRVAGTTPSVSLGFALVCNDCATTAPGGATRWTFRTHPVVGAVERGSVAERMGLQRGDTLRTIDDISLTTTQGGTRLSSIEPGRTVKLGWSRNGVTHTAAVTVPRDNRSGSSEALRLTSTVGTARVEIRGNASWTRDPETGALRITGDGMSVTVTPR